MAFCLLLPFLNGQEIAAKIIPMTELSQKDLLEVTVYRLVLDPSSLQPVVLLKEGERVMPIWIGPNEAAAIQGVLEGTTLPRPTTHDLLERVIQRFNGSVRRVIITREKEGIYYALIVLEKDKTLHELDARPSDSIVMALKFKAPVFIPRSLFNQRSIPLSEQETIEESFGLTIQDLTPALAESHSFEEGKGVLIVDVREGSHAEKDGFQRGDVLVEIGEEKIEGVAALRTALGKMEGPVKAKVFRKGTWSTLTLNPAPD